MWPRIQKRLKKTTIFCSASFSILLFQEEEDDVFPSTEENQNQEKDKSYVRCKVCQKVMRRKSYQQVSKEIKISIPFLCVQHKQKHDGEDRKFGCSYCETKFRKSEHLQEHMKRFHEQSR